MALANLDDDDYMLNELVDFEDYNVIPRPQELIELQRKSSGLKSKETSGKSSFESSKLTVEIKESKLQEKNIEKSSISKHGRKGAPKAKLLFKSRRRETSPSKKRAGDELDSKFESLIQNAKNVIAKQRSETPKTSGNEINQAANKELQHLKMMGEPAVTPQQRYEVLDARDSVIRSKDAKQGDSKKPKVSGCCPDMCPEKERYSRIAKNCLSLFEMKTIFDSSSTSRDANHSFMVKEYSRSSADQQEPLPHELRPIPVLMFTMDYLICNIMDIPLDNISLADWYDFIWNRTRSIRKDITQQQLCGIRCVDIIEKCVRFHIHCAEALSEEDTSTFDPRINNENLTKGLQTLKHMYQDLQSRGVQCPNEAEFRAYDILLSLTEGETLRLVKDIRKDLLKSPMVKLAFEASLAFKSSNYVKFFKIIEKANYLNSCILHRYILEARADALQIIVRAYSTPSSSSMYPTLNLVRDLKFENSAEACEFCRSYGLEGNENYITIERRVFSKSASGLSLSRSFLLVGSKRNETLGEIINNGELPTNPLDWYQPHDSFDERNMLKNDSLDSALEDNEQEVEVVDLTDEAEMEDVSIDDKSQHAKSSITSSVFPVKNQNSNFQIPKSVDIDVLVKARSALLDEISKLKSVSQKISERKKEQSSHSKLKSASKSHKSIMYSEDSSSLPQAPEHAEVPLNVQPSKEKSIITTSAATSNLLPSASFSFTAPSLPKFGLSSIPKTLNDVTAMNTNEPLQKNIPENTSIASSFSFKPSTLGPASVFQSALNQNSSFTAGASAPVVPKDVFPSKVTGQTKDLPQKSPFTVKSAEFNFNAHVPPVEKVLAPLERKIIPPADMPKPFDSSVPINDESVVDELVADDFDGIKSISEESEEDTEEMRENRRQLEFDEFLKDLVEELCAKCVEECSVSICEEVLSQEKRRMAELEDEYEMMKRYLMRKTIVKWRYFCERKRQRRHFENSAFCSPWQAMLSNTLYVNTGVATPMVVYRKQCNLSRVAAEKIKRSREVVPGCEVYKPEEIWKLTDCKPHPATYFGKSGITHFFKLCLVFPSKCDKSDLSVFLNWICAKFSLPSCQVSEINRSNTFVLNNGKTVICVRAVQLGPQLTSKYKEFLDGITAMVLCVPCFADLEVQNAFFKDFTALLDADILMYPYPLFTFLLGSQENSANLLSFLNEKHDSVYFTDIKTKFLSNVKDFCQNSKEIIEAINWLIKKRSAYPLLQQCDIRYYLEDSFTFAFNILYCKVSLEEYQQLKEVPQHIINFYNKVLKFRSSVLHSDLLTRLVSSWPPQELTKLHPDMKFIDMQKQQKCKERMKLILLPNFEGDPSSTHSVWQYVEDVAVLSCQNKDMLIIRIKNALGTSNSFPDWLTVLNICALHLIYSVDSVILNPSETLNVYYTKEDLETFESDEFWQDVSSDIRKTHLSNSKRKHDSVLDSPLKKQRSDIIYEEIVCDSVPFEEPNYFSSAFDVPDVFSCQRKNLFSTLEVAVAEQKKQSEAFLRQLDESIISGNVLNDNQFNQYEEEHLSQEMNASDEEISVSNADISFPKFSSSQNSTTEFRTGIDWIDNPLLNKTSHESSLASMADKLAELKYNIQKSSILEDHFSQLLSKQI